MGSPRLAGAMHVCKQASMHLSSREIVRLHRKRLQNPGKKLCPGCAVSLGGKLDARPQLRDCDCGNHHVIVGQQT